MFQNQRQQGTPYGPPLDRPPPVIDPNRKTAYRRIVDHGNIVSRWVLQRSMGIRKQRLGKVRPEASFTLDMLPPASHKDEFPVMDVQTKFIHLSANKARHAINTIKWTPEGRRLISANYAGELTLWNGMTFNFETIMQAHDLSIFLMSYSHNDEWLILGDQEGKLKFWQPNFNNVKIVDAHVDAVRDIAFLPNDLRFVTCSDDRFLKVWNFNTGKEEKTLKGHNWDVKCCDWHPTLGLIVSGSKDNLIKLWDPRSSSCVSTIYGFKHLVAKTKFQPTGSQRLLASASKDRLCKIFDLRAMKDLLLIRSHDADLSSIAWHPVHSSMLSTGGFDGSINHYLLNSNQFEETDRTGLERAEDTAPSIEPMHVIPYAHEKGVNCLEYHPLGHVLCSAGADRSARFWCRSRPNDPHAFNDELYTNVKIGAWHYAINNNVNAVRSLDTPPGAPTAIAGLGHAAQKNSKKNEPEIDYGGDEGKPEPLPFTLPGLGGN